MKRIRPRVLIAVLALATALPAAADVRFQGPDGEDLPFRTDEEVLEFLKTAHAEKVKVITSGINRPLKVLLTKDGVRAHAVFRTVDVKKDRFEGQNAVIMDFRDSYIYECAAYEMSRLLGFTNVPPCVSRRLWAEVGSLQLWIEDSMTEEARREEGTSAPSSLRWVRQNQIMRLFDALIRNYDRNQGNILIDRSWKMWLIDHGRSFHKSPVVDNVDRLVYCERGMWERLKGLDKKTLRERLGDFLVPAEIAFVLKRRDTIVRHLEERIAAISEDVVLYSEADDAPADPESLPDYELAGSTDDIPVESEIEEEGGGS